MDNELLTKIIVAVLGSSVLTTILNRIFSVSDKNKVKIDSLLNTIHDISIKVESIDNKLSNHIEDSEINDMNLRRIRILTFSDKITTDGDNFKVSQERFNNIIEDIDIYIQYCNTHLSYINSKSDAAIKNIRETYDKFIRGEMNHL